MYPIPDDFKELYIELGLNIFSDLMLMTGFSLDGDPVTALVRHEIQETPEKSPYVPMAILIDDTLFNRLDFPKKNELIAVFTPQNAVIHEMRQHENNYPSPINGLADFVLDTMYEEDNNYYGSVFSFMELEFPDISSDVIDIVNLVCETKKKVVIISSEVIDFPAFELPISILYPTKDKKIDTDSIPFFDLALIINEHLFSQETKKAIHKELLIKANIGNGTSVVSTVRQGQKHLVEEGEF